MDYIKGGHNVYLITYHIVFVTKYRKPVINEEISEFLKEHIAYLCGRFGAELLTAETDRDHIHLLVSMTPTAALPWIYYNAPNKSLQTYVTNFCLFRFPFPVSFFCLLSSLCIFPALSCLLFSCCYLSLLLPFSASFLFQKPDMRHEQYSFVCYNV